MRERRGPLIEMEVGTRPFSLSEHQDFLFFFGVELGWMGWPIEVCLMQFSKTWAVGKRWFEADRNFSFISRFLVALFGWFLRTLGVVSGHAISLIVYFEL